MKARMEDGGWKMANETARAILLQSSIRNPQSSILALSRLAAERHKIIHVQQVKPGRHVFAFGRHGRLHFAEILPRFQVRRPRAAP